jgi:ariadne-1
MAEFRGISCESSGRYGSDYSDGGGIDDNNSEYTYDSESPRYNDDDDSPRYDVDNNMKLNTIETIQTKKISEVLIADGKYIIQDYLDIAPFIVNVIKEISSMFDIDDDAAQILLQNCSAKNEFNIRWNKEKLMDQYFSNQDKLLDDAGLSLYSSAIIKQRLSGLNNKVMGEQVVVLTDDNKTSKNEMFTCPVCYCEEDVKDSFSLGCDHKFCITCYSEYLHTQIGDGPACLRAHCPQHKCNQAITKSVYHQLVKEEAFKRYEMFLMKNFIETSKNMKYCPAAGCEKVAVGTGITTVRCSCSNPFCFKCGDEAHDPCSCAQLNAWREKCQNDSETANWIVANTKKCPKCNTNIEKNQGCNHMSCKLCTYQFCWICMGNWSEHNNNYNCNRYDPKNKSPELTAAEQAKTELDRYLHYFQRYMNHEKSLKYEINRRNKATLQQRLETQQASWIDIHELKQATDQVIDCRRILKYTYALGYFLEDKTPEKQLFEHHQEMLEKNTDMLHEITEKALEDIDHQKVVNLTKVTEKFSQSLLANIVDGVVQNEASIFMMNQSSSSTSSSSSSSAAVQAVKPEKLSGSKAEKSAKSTKKK